MKQVRTTANSGSRAVLAMFAVAIAAASFAWWWNRERGRQALDFYGPEAVELIRTASKVEASRDGESVRDISKAKGLLNARTSLLNDASYRTIDNLELSKSDYTLRFSEGEKSVTLFFDTDERRIQMACTSKSAELAEKTAEGWRSYLERQMGPMQLTPLGPKRTDPSE